ncbi:hypothetical protein MMC28_004128 [Mycoblastus sanguinarius]|nr:hypothetical protein [Mycoblastus sanguinarius]
MYTHKYNDGNSRVARSNDLMMNNALVYAIGEKYNLEPLKQLAVTKFSAYTDQVRPWIDEFASVVRFIYETTHADGDALRDLVVKACSPHFKDIMSSRNWREIMVDFGDFGLGIADAARKHYEEGPERTDIQIQLWDLSSITSRAAALGAGSPHCIECLETLEEKINKASGSLWTM